MVEVSYQVCVQLLFVDNGVDDLFLLLLGVCRGRPQGVVHIPDVPRQMVLGRGMTLCEDVRRDSDSLFLALLKPSRPHVRFKHLGSGIHKTILMSVLGVEPESRTVGARGACPRGTFSLGGLTR